ncbi:MAG: hypothetical protein WCG27_06230, partial [Pseudomonadota bacterium]
LIAAREGLSDITSFPVFAYPFGRMPQNTQLRLGIKLLLKKMGYHYALRIGNRQNSYPFRDPYELERLDIDGTYDTWQFALKLIWGKCPLW